MIMSSEATFIPEIDLLSCPFIDIYTLPKHQIICKIPECKICPDYVTKVRELKSRVLY